VLPEQSDPVTAVSLSYISVNETGRITALRRLLDALDPESAFVVTAQSGVLGAVEYLLRSLATTRTPRWSARVVRRGKPQLIVLFDFPVTELSLRAAVNGRQQARIVALVTAPDLRAARFAGGSVTPLNLPEAAARARSREDALRDELRATLATGQFSRELLALEPLLSEHDGAEVAAAALRLLDTERSKHRQPPRRRPRR